MRRLALLVGLALVLRLDGVVMTRQLFSVSHYTDLSGIPPYGITASGARTHDGLCACGPSYEFGTVFILDAGAALDCQDRGGAITDSHIDVWVPVDADGSEATALRMGRHSEWVWVVEGAEDAKSDTKRHGRAGLRPDPGDDPGGAS